MPRPFPLGPFGFPRLRACNRLVAIIQPFCGGVWRLHRPSTAKGTSSVPLYSTPGVPVGIAPPTPSYNPFDDDTAHVTLTAAPVPAAPQPVFHSSPGFSHSHLTSRSIPSSKPEVSPSVPPKPAQDLPTPSTFVDFDPFGLPPAITASSVPVKHVKAPEPVSIKPIASPHKPVGPGLSSGLHLDASHGKPGTVAVWVCARCTFENKLDTFPCEMCGYDDVLPADVTTKPAPKQWEPPSTRSSVAPAALSALLTIPDVHGNFLQRIKTGRWSRVWKPVYIHASGGKLNIFKSRDSYSKVGFVLVRCVFCIGVRSVLLLSYGC
jgi:hypothetical protein